jgi:hypothetical protein
VHFQTTTSAARSRFGPCIKRVVRETRAGGEAPAGSRSNESLTYENFSPSVERRYS